MLIKREADIKSSEITSEHIYTNRRSFIKKAMKASIALTSGSSLLALAPSVTAAIGISKIEKGPFSTDEAATPYKEIIRYNNFYEFGTEKEQPAVMAKQFKTDPWRIKVDGAVNKPADYLIEDFIKPHKLEERIYRLRCVEAWSMVVPWVGIPLAEMIKRFEPTSKAKYVEFTTLYDPQQMPGQRREVLAWPYVEGLRIDEAMHPLTMLAVGLYGKVLPNQNGAPIRLVVPWKYGFKSIKSIVRIRFTESEPVSSWMKAGPGEYGFYANVNPEVDHPRWTQSKERRIGDFLKRKTMMFNGYQEQVASLYSGMDLRKHF